MLTHSSRAIFVFAMLFQFAPAAAQPIELLATFNLTGDSAVLDLPCYRGAMVAVEEVNADGGVLGRPLKLVAVDTKSDLAETAALVEDALQAHPAAVAGIGYAYSTFVLEAAPAFQTAGIPFVTPGATDPNLPERIGDNMFLACYGDDAQAKAMAIYAYNQLKLRRVALWADRDRDYTQTVAKWFAEAFTALGGTVVRTDIPGDEPDFSALIETFEIAEPAFDAIYSASWPRSGEQQIEQCRTMGVDVPLLSGDGWDDPQIVELTKDHGFGDIYFTSHRFRGVESPAMKSFIAAYKSQFDESPSTAFAPLGYDTVHLLADAIRRADSTDREALRKSLAATNDFRGIVGPITYADGLRVPSKPVEVIRLEAGKLVPVWEVTPELD